MLGKHPGTGTEANLQVRVERNRVIKLKERIKDESL